MINGFLENRKSVQKALFNSEYIKPLLSEDSELTITEKSADSLELKYLTIDNIPVCSGFDEPISWVIELELQGSIFSAPPKFKTVEKAFIVFSCSTLYVIMVEMKTTLKAYAGGLGEEGIEKKIKDSISRISLVLPNYIFLKEKFENIKKVEYNAIIVYNEDDVTSHILADKSLVPVGMIREFSKFRRSEGFDIKVALATNDPSDTRFTKVNLNTPKAPVFITDSLGKENPVFIYFVHNLGDPERTQIDLLDIMSDNTDFQYCIHSTDTLPSV